MQTKHLMESNELKALKRLKNLAGDNFLAVLKEALENELGPLAFLSKHPNTLSLIKDRPRDFLILSQIALKEEDGISMLNGWKSMDMSADSTKLSEQKYRTSVSRLENNGWVNKISTDDITAGLRGSGVGVKLDVSCSYKSIKKYETAKNNATNNVETAEKHSKNTHISVDVSHPLQAYVQSKYSCVPKMRDQLTPDQCDILIESLGKKKIVDLLNRMDNWQDLLKKNVSVFLTIKNWAAKEEGPVTSSPSLFSEKTVGQ